MTPEPSSIKIYPVSASRLAVSTSTGDYLTTYASSDITLDSVGGFVRLITPKFGIQYYNPNQVLKADGSTYSTVSSDAVITAFNGAASVSATKIEATTYADALLKIASLPSGFSALVLVAADESEGNAGTGTNGVNPATFYIYFPSTGLKQLVTYP